MPKERHLYKHGATFDKVMMLYRFDKKLRLLAFNEIEKIEIAVRSSVINAGCEITGNPFWLTDSQSFVNQGKFSQTIKLIDDELRRSREEFIVHFKDNYSNPYPPAWILAEVLPFGVITTIFSNIKNKRIKKQVSQQFGLQVAPLNLG